MKDVVFKSSKNLVAMWSNVRQRKRLGAGLIIGSALAALVWSAWPRERHLLRVAKAVVATKYTDQIGGICAQFWQSNNELLLLRSSPTSNSSPLPNASVLSASLVNWRTGKVHPLAPFNALVGSSMAPQWPGWLFLEVRRSPDGKWLWWPESHLGGLHGDRYCRFAAVDGSRSCIWKMPRYWYDAKVHQADTTHTVICVWLSRKTSAEGELFDPENPGNRRRVRALGYKVESEFVSGIGPDGARVSYTFAGAGSKSAFMTEYKGYADQTATRRWQIRLPNAINIGQIAISPDGKRLAWLIDRRPPLPRSVLDRWLARMFGWRFREQRAIWLSAIDGSDMHEIGHLPLRSTEMPFWRSLQWSPDGRHLSFMTERFVYVVSTS